MSNGLFNYDQYTQFMKQFNTKANNINNFIKNWCLERANQVLEKVKDRTPVDTGLLLASWQDPKLKISGNVIEIIFENTADYAGYVEYGHNTRGHAGEPIGGEHWVEGRFMLTVPLQDFQRDIQAEFGTAVWSYIVRNYR